MFHCCNSKTHFSHSKWENRHFSLHHIVTESQTGSKSSQTEKMERQLNFFSPAAGKLWNLLGVSSRLVYWLWEPQLVPTHRCFPPLGADGRNLSCRKKTKTHSGSSRLNVGARFRLTHPESRRGLALMLRVEKMRKRADPGSPTSINSRAKSHKMVGWASG